MRAYSPPCGRRTKNLGCGEILLAPLATSKYNVPMQAPLVRLAFQLGDPEAAPLALYLAWLHQAYGASPWLEGELRLGRDRPRAAGGPRVAAR